MYCFKPSVYVVLSVVNLPGTSAVASLLLLTTLLTFPLVFGLKLFLASPAVPVLLLASPAVPVVSRVAVGPAVDVFLPLLVCLWSPCYG